MPARATSPKRGSPNPNPNPNPPPSSSVAATSSSSSLAPNHSPEVVSANIRTISFQETPSDSSNNRSNSGSSKGSTSSHLSIRIPRDTPTSTESVSRPVTPAEAEYPDPSSSEFRRPNVIQFRVILYLIDNVDSQKQSFFSNFYIGVHDRNKDESTSGTKSFQMAYSPNKEHWQDNFSSCELPKWHTTLLNAVEFKDLYNEKNLPSTRRFEDGTFMERHQVNATFFTDFHLECFPFDSQLLKIIVSLDAPAYVATFHDSFNRHSVTQDDAYKQILEKAEWKQGTTFFTIEKKRFEGGGGDKSRYWQNLTKDEKKIQKDLRNTYERLHVYIPVERKYANHVVTILLPLAILNFSTLIAFTEIASSDALTLISTLLLSVFTLKWSLTGILPKISYNCTMDKLFILSFFYMFACMCLISFKSFWSDTFSRNFMLIDCGKFGTDEFKCGNVFKYVFLSKNQDDFWDVLKRLYPIILKLPLAHVIAVFFRHKYTRKDGIIYNLQKPNEIVDLGVWEGIMQPVPMGFRNFLHEYLWVQFLSRILFNDTDKEPGISSVKPYDQKTCTTTVNTCSTVCAKKWDQLWEYVKVLLSLEFLFFLFDFFNFTEYWCKYTSTLENENYDSKVKSCNNSSLSIAAYFLMYTIILSLGNIIKDVLECQGSFKQEVNKIYKRSNLNQEKDKVE